jgi:hypothetical protein
MNKKLNLFINISIILLIVALIVVMINCYTDTSVVPTYNHNSGENEEMELSGDTKIDEEIISETNEIIKIDSEKNNNELVNLDSNLDMKNDELISGDLSGGDKILDQIQINEEKIESPVIMTSENDISSKEKKEILSDLDKTLMELLEVVDRVQAIDETRLITDDSEVQK